MKFYIASSSKFIDKCKQVSLLFEKNNFVNTRKWWNHYILESYNKLNNDKEFYSQPSLQIVRELDFKAVKDADIVIIVVEDRYKLTGALVELGFALALNKIVLVYGKIKRSAMFSSCIHLESSDELLNFIEKTKTN